jgi:ABC-type transport system involved in multi-copper enzyme maturation permease subunit
MAFENDILTYWEWLLGDPTKLRPFDPSTWGFLFGSLAILLLLAILAPLVCFLVAAVRLGPSEGFYAVAKAVFSSVTEDLPRFSLRRTFAIARLAIQEARRNRVLVGFGVFVVVLLFAGLFLDVENSNPARVYLSFVLTTTNFLVLLMALFLSAFSLPNDIKNRTIYTVLTKPISAGEVVLGRVIGFAAVGTAMIVGMGLVSYVFVIRGLAHDHVFAAADLEPIPPPEPGLNSPGKQGKTSFDDHHRHTVTVDADGKPVIASDGSAHTSRDAGHWHNVEVTGAGAAAKYTIGPHQGWLVARAPVFGKLEILDRDGNKGKGISVGQEWEYRGYIEGGSSSAAATWTFDGITPEKYPDGLPLELNLRVFRSYKGNIERGILGEIIIRNPNPQAKVRSSGPIVFESKEFVADFKRIPRKLYSASGGGAGDGTIDLFDDLVDNGKVEVVIRCAEPGQYFGVARGDVYLRPADGSFALNFCKAYFSIWLQMLLVTCFGVTLSTFLSGPVAMMASVSAIVLGFFGQTVRDVASGAQMGGGPLESLIRIVTQQNVQTELEIPRWIDNGMKWIDWFLMQIMVAGTYIFPDYTQFDTSKFVVNGYNIYPSLVGQQVTMALVYFMAAAIVGYFFLKTREIAA